MLKDRTFSTAAKQIGLAECEINFENVGCSAVLDERRVQLVLCKGELHCAAHDDSTDARTWCGGESGMTSGSLLLPSDMETGDCEVPLHITDPDAELGRRLEHNGKVANSGTLNEEDTGLIDLNHSLTTSSGSGAAKDPPLCKSFTSTSFCHQWMFEGSNVASDWAMCTNGCSVVTKEMHSGSQSITISNGHAQQTLDLTSDPVPENCNIVIGGWSKEKSMGQNCIVKENPPTTLRMVVNEIKFNLK